ncbi:secondary thiamine-phosphate synthase enzyme YjbQ [Dankookia sp. P2]|uniref:secondary thiamine-phosphate synthase enzyme YjbQ n=1 Tax=Dankookia sp. P2 TaxID=3423955 RepID=UPI003D6687B6
MHQHLHRVVADTPGRGLVDVTSRICPWVSAQGISTGLLTVWCRHTSASLLVQENASPDVRADLKTFLARLVPDGGADHYRHVEEGPDDMPAHIRAALTQTQLSIPVTDGRPVLGTWQGIYLWEHRTSPHQRELVVHLLGAPAHG